jgi:hypothetical protein
VGVGASWSAPNARSFEELLDECSGETSTPAPNDPDLTELAARREATFARQADDALAPPPAF